MKWIVVVILAMFASCNRTRVVYVVPSTDAARPTDLYHPNRNLWFDDFDGRLSLDWNIMGADPTHWSLEKVPGSLTVTTQDGTFTFSRTGYKNIFLIDFPGDGSEDFQVTTCISHYRPYDLWNRAGLILWNDKGTSFLFAYEYGEGPPPNNAEKLLFTVAREQNNGAVHGWYETEQSPQKMWLRIVKRGEVYTMSHSTDGELFAPMKVIQPARLTRDSTVPCLDEPLKYIGLFADNGTALGAAEVDASFDFFELKLLPEEE